MLLSCVRIFATPWTVAYQVPPSMGFSRQEWVGCHFLLQEIFPTQGSNPGLLHCRQMLYHLSHRGRLRSNQSFLKGNQHWLFTGRIDAEAEAPILWSPDEKSRLIRKDPDSGRIEGRRRRGWQGMRWLDSITKPIQWTWTWEISGR